MAGNGGWQWRSVAGGKSPNQWSIGIIVFCQMGNSEDKELQLNARTRLTLSLHGANKLLLSHQREILSSVLDSLTSLAAHIVI